MKPASTVAVPGSEPRAGGRGRSALARWVMWDAGREVVRQFRLAWITIPVAAKLRYAATLGAGFVACLILTAGMTLLAKWWAPKGLAAYPTPPMPP